MKKKLKQILSALLVAVMLIGIAPVGDISIKVKAVSGNGNDVVFNSKLCRLNGNYYLIAYDSREGIIKHFRVDKMLNIESNDTGHSSLKPTTLHNRYEYFFGSFFKNNRTSRTTSTVTPAVRLILSTCKNIFSNTQSPFSCLYAHATYAHQ